MKIVSFGGSDINDGANFTARLIPPVRGLPRTQPNMARRTGRWPIFGGMSRPDRTLLVQIIINGDVDTLRPLLHQIFDPEDEIPAALVISDYDDGRPRYMMALCQSLQETQPGRGTEFIASLQIDGDVRWRGVTAVSVDTTWPDDEPSVTLANGGEDVAFPIISITPKAAKSGDSFLYARWIPIRWRIDEPGNLYPVELTDGGWDTAALVSASKMQASGNDLRVFVDGAEVANRAIFDINDTNTQVWTALNFEARQEVTVVDAIGSSGAVDSITAAQSIDGFPAQGILMIDNEAFIYTSKNNSLRRFLGISRARRGTSMAAHSAGATAWWVQRDVFIRYGNPSAGAGPFNPVWGSGMMTPESSNSKWVWYEVKAGDGIYHQSAAWHYVSIASFNAPYTELRGQQSGTEEYSAAGVEVFHEGRGMWYVINPCGFSNAKFDDIDGYKNEHMATNRTLWDGKVMAGVFSHTGLTLGRENSLGDYILYDIPAPSTNDTWEEWTANEAVNTSPPRRVIALWLRALPPGSSEPSTNYLDGRGGIELDIISSRRPTLAMGAEQESYNLAGEITNLTTGDVLRINFEMGIDQTLEIDTVNKRVVFLEDGSGQYQALEVIGLRRDWLPLLPGNNAFLFTDAGGSEVDVNIEWEERFYG
jgi:hypothetical protein